MRADPSYLVISPFLFSVAILVFKKHSKLLSTLEAMLNLLLVSILFLKGDYDFYISNWVSKGIHLLVDFNTKVILLMISIVFLSVTLNSLKKDYNHHFYFFSSVFLASTNASMMAYDLFNIYVVIELASLTAYLLIGYKQKTIQLWASLKYLILSSVALNFYLLGIGIIYAYNRTFDISKIEVLPEISIVFVLVGLLAKSGIFFMSMWLPLAHSEAETEVSALLSGIFVKIGAFQIIKLLSIEAFSTARPLISMIAIVSSILGTVYAFSEKSTKKVLAYSTLSQMGFVLSGTSLANILHMFNHGIFKSLLFLTVGDSVENMEKKNFQDLKDKKIPLLRNLTLKIALFGIMGVPLFSGFVSKSLVDHEMHFTGKIGLSIAAVGTVASLWRFLSLRTQRIAKEKIRENIGYLILTIFVILVGAIGTFKMNLSDILKSLILIALGVLVYKIFKLGNISKVFEKLDNALFIYIIFCVLGLIFFTVI